MSEVASWSFCAITVGLAAGQSEPGGATKVPWAIHEVLDTLAAFGFIGADDVERALDWLNMPAEWPRV
jgi:hypothetical protein